MIIKLPDTEKVTTWTFTYTTEDNFNIVVGKKKCVVPGRTKTLRKLKTILGDENVHKNKTI